jgi:hypothetical protein
MEVKFNVHPVDSSFMGRLPELADKDAPSFTIPDGKFWMLGEARLEVGGEYGLAVVDDPFCLRCGKPVRLQGAMTGIPAKGFLECECSSWTSEVSPWSGRFYTSNTLKRDKVFTEEERALRLWTKMPEKYQGLLKEKILAKTL